MLGFTYQGEQSESHRGQSWPKYKVSLSRCACERRLLFVRWDVISNPLSGWSALDLERIKPVRVTFQIVLKVDVVAIILLIVALIDRM